MSKGPSKLEQRTALRIRKHSTTPKQRVVHVEDPEPDGMELEEAVVTAVKQVKSRVGKKQLNVWIDDELVKELKHAAIEQETTVEAIVGDALTKALRP